MSLMEIPYISIVPCASYIRNHDIHSTLNPARGKSLALKEKPVYFLL